jgi:outer membrane receptor protein involved in Fe transport
MLKKAALLLIIIFYSSTIFSQGKTGSGVLTGNVISEVKKPVEAATAELLLLSDTLQRISGLTTKDGSFSLQPVPYGHYRLRITFVGMQPLIIDSIFFREDRSDFNLDDLVLKSAASADLSEVIIYAEKPLIQSKDGNITFNAGESALSAGSTAGELLTNVPLVSKDPDGKISVRGKEPRILIDDKPVELNLQQLQDLLESMPGSSIEKIEVMTNPPPQYANEQGGVINIVTKKGRIGRSGRLNLSGGTRGQLAISGYYTYRKQGLALAVTGGLGYNRFEGNSYSLRHNIYADSSNYFNTRSNNSSHSLRPNLRVTADYDLNKFNSINTVLQLNSSDYGTQSWTEYKNISKDDAIYRLSNRSILNDGRNYNSSLSLSYLMKTKNAGEQLRAIFSGNYSTSNSDRDFFQQYFFPDYTPDGRDSIQQQLNDNRGSGYSGRVDYTRPLNSRKTILTFGTYYLRNNSDVETDASYYRKSDAVYAPLDALSNDLRFHQSVVNLRTSVKQLLSTTFSITGGLAAEQTSIWFELFKEGRDARNNYWTWLPFANLNKSWNDQFNLTLAWRRSIRRPGINELNPTVDFSDPYNVRFGNEKLRASTADNFDFVFGKTTTRYYVNIGAGYNIVKDIYSRVRTLLTDGKTQTTWQNISGRREYEVSTWGGLTIARKLRANMSSSYTFNQYSLFDRTNNRYRNGGSFTSNMNASYTFRDLWTFTSSFNFNRFANPQGYARWNWSMNTGIQRKLFNKRVTTTLNLIDIFSPQRNRTFTYGPNFDLESHSSTNTRNVRLTIGYNFMKRK